MYIVLLRHLDYAEDFDVAELEIELEGAGKLDAFERDASSAEGKPLAEVRAFPSG